MCVLKPARFSSPEYVYLPCFKYVTYGVNSITNVCIHSMNRLTEVVVKQSSLSTTEVKRIMSKINYIANY